MDKVKAFLLKLFYTVFKPNLSEIVAQPLAKNPGVVEFSKSYTDGGSLRECIRASMSVTPGAAGDFTKADAAYQEFKEKLASILEDIDETRMLDLVAKLDSFKIPDGDADPTNDVGLGQLITEILAEVKRLSEL